jgi:hypothetical protein
MIGVGLPVGIHVTEPVGNIDQTVGVDWRWFILQ